MTASVWMDFTSMKTRRCVKVGQFMHKLRGTFYTVTLVQYTLNNWCIQDQPCIMYYCSLYYRYPDIDECSLGTSLCQQQCVNTDGGYNCTCSRWYVPGSPGNCSGLLDHSTQSY